MAVVRDVKTTINTANGINGATQMNIMAERKLWVSPRSCTVSKSVAGAQQGQDARDERPGGLQGTEALLSGEEDCMRAVKSG